MKRVLLIIALLVLILPSCNSSSNKVRASLGQEFVLAINQTSEISGENLLVKFTDVIGDSRCPTGVECIWAGQVSCILDITISGKTSQTVITGPGDTSDYANATYQKYSLKFRVDPYPQSGKTISKSDYRLYLTINKNS